MRGEGEHRVAFGNAVARFENSELFVEVLHRSRADFQEAVVFARYRVAFKNIGVRFDVVEKGLCMLHRFQRDKHE